MFVYIDESGDTGFKFDRGSTRYFIVTLLLVEDPIPLQRVIDELRASVGFAPHVEFHFASSSSAIRERFLQAIQPLEFNVRALIIDKQLMTRPHMRKRETFYNYVVRLCLTYDSGVITDATLVLDESVQSKKAKREFRTYLRRILNTDTSPAKVRRVIYRRSHTDNLIQVADMICGAIYAAYERNEPRYRQIIRRHIRDEWAWRPHSET